MATYTLTGTLGGRIYSTGTLTYADARSGASGLSSDDAGNSGLTVGQLYFFGLGGYSCYEAFVQFDTSSVLGTPSSATLSLYCRVNNGTVAPFTVYARAHDWGTSLTTADWVAGASLSAKSLRASSAVNTSISAGAYHDFTSDGSFVSNVANPVRLILSSSLMEANTAPSSAVSGVDNSAYDQRVFFDTPTGANPPKLTIVTDYVLKGPVSTRRRPSGLYTR